MAQKESNHKEVVDDLTKQLNQVRKQHEDLQVLSRDQVRRDVPMVTGTVNNVTEGPQYEHRA